jgi:sigma-B regulation protein RsbU (phosphoserine phosphatase)
MDWYLIPKTLLKPNWTEPYFENSGDHIFMSTFSTPFFRFSGTKEKFCGIVSVDVSIETLTSKVESMGKKMMGDVIFLSENGTVITSTDKNWINNQTIFTLSAEKNLPVLREIGRDLQKGISGVKKIDEFENQKDVYAFYLVIPINKWGFILFLPKEELNKD